MGILAKVGQHQGKDFTTAHASPRAVLTWNKPNLPCMDLWPWWGNIAPNQRKSIAGRFNFLDGADPNMATARMEGDRL